MSDKNKSIIAGLDIGSTKVALVIGEKTSESLNIIGVGQATNQGVRAGAVINIDVTSEAILKAKEEAELMAGVEVKEVWLSVGGLHIESFSSEGMIAIRGKEIKEEDVARVIETANAVALPSDRQILHVLPNSFKVDAQDGVLDPIGMYGVRLETSVRIITGAQSAINNSVKCVEKSGLKLNGVVLTQLASALAVLSEDEKHVGVSVVDIGGGSCDIISFKQGNVTYTGTLPVGGVNFTHDVAIGLKTTQSNAEKIKKEHGCALNEMVSEGDPIEVAAVGDNPERTISKKSLCEILEARAEECYQLIKTKIDESGQMESLGAGLVVTGGASQLSGFVEMGDFIFDLPVRRGMPQKIGGLTDVVKSSQYSTAVGLLMYGVKQNKKLNKKTKGSSQPFGDRASKVMHKIKNIIVEAF